MANRRGIRRKILTNTIVIIVLVALVLVGLMTFFMSLSAGSILKETLQPIAKTAAQSVEGNLHILADRIFLTRDNEIISDLNTTKQQNQAVLDRTMSGIEFVWLALYDDEGKLETGSEGSLPSLTDQDLTLYDEIMETKNLVINDTIKGKEDFEILIGVPVVVNEKVEKILVGSYKYDALNDALTNINVGSNGTALIVNEDGEIMAHKDKDRVSENASVESVVGDTDEFDEVFEQMRLGQTGIVELSNGGDNLFLSYAPIRGTEWVLIILTHKDDFTSANRGAVASSIGVTVIILILAIFLSVNMSRRIQRPLGRVTKRITDLADGDLHSEVVIEKTKDETEALSVALDKTIKDINSYTSELSRVLSELSNSNLDVSVKGEFRGDFVLMKDSLNKIIKFMNQMMDSIQQGSAQVLDTSKIVSSNAESVKMSSGSQSESIKHLNEETASIQGNIVEVENSTLKVAELVEKVKKTLTDSQKDMKSTLNAMENISKNSDEITDINKLLEDISFQTNILALNAAVEAVNAGLAGKGFAVVADEVRALAEKSGESSKKTRSMIEQSKKSIDQGSEYVDQLVAAMNAILEMIEDISEITTKLTEAVKTQTSSLENITQQVNNINELASGNLLTSSASAEASHELTQEADSLREMAGRFKLRKTNDLTTEKNSINKNDDDGENDE